MLSMLVAYDLAGNVIQTLDHMVVKDDQGNVVGLVDFEAHESAGGDLLAIWNAEGAAGSGTWPEWIGSAAHDFRVELEPGWSRTIPAADRPAFRICAIIHHQSGHRRERGAVEEAIARRIQDAHGAPADIRDLVGGPDRPLVLDEAGRTVGRTPPPSTPAGLPVIGRGSQSPNTGRRPQP